jgi:hypothetical protein
MQEVSVAGSFVEPLMSLIIFTKFSAIFYVSFLLNFKIYPMIDISLTLPNKKVNETYSQEVGRVRDMSIIG